MAVALITALLPRLTDMKLILNTIMTKQELIEIKARLEQLNKNYRLTLDMWGQTISERNELRKEVDRLLQSSSEMNRPCLLHKLLSRLKGKP